jgi:hypothetical protein
MHSGTNKKTGEAAVFIYLSLMVIPSIFPRAKQDSTVMRKLFESCKITLPLFIAVTKSVNAVKK